MQPIMNCPAGLVTFGNNTTAHDARIRFCTDQLRSDSASEPKHSLYTCLVPSGKALRAHPDLQNHAIFNIVKYLWPTPGPRCSLRPRIIRRAFSCPRNLSDGLSHFPLQASHSNDPQLLDARIPAPAFPIHSAMRSVTVLDLATSTGVA